MTYRADIDGMRAVAVTAVLLYHLDPRWLPGGFIGVDVFFTVSGFVVCASLAAAGHQSFGRFIGEFYARRLARIIPALVATLCVTAVFATLFIPRAWLSGFSEATGRSAFFGLSNWVMQSNSDTYFAPRAELNPYTHTWSLGVEEQFYVLFPAVCFFWVVARATGLAGQRALSSVFLGVLFALSLVACALASTSAPTAAFYSVAFRFWELAAGALLYQLTADLVTLPASVAVSQDVLPWAGVALLAVGLLAADGARFPYPWALTAVAGTLLIIGTARIHAHVVRRILGHKVLTWLGKRSYSLYLWHWPVIVLLRWTIGVESLTGKVMALAAALLLGMVSFRWVEQPLRHHRWLERQRLPLRIAVFLLLVLAGWRFVDGIVWRGGLSVVSKNAQDWYPDGRMPDAGSLPRRCRTASAHEAIEGGSRSTYTPIDCQGRLTSATLFALGDSHATAFAPSYEQISAETGLSVVVYTSAGCSFLNLLAPMDALPDSCVAFWRLASADALTTATSRDVVFLPSLRQYRFVEQWGTLQYDVEKLSVGEEALERVSQAVKDAEHWLAPFNERGVRLVFEAPPPLFRSPPFRCSDWFNRHNPVCDGGSTQSRAYLLELRAPVVAAEQTLATSHRGVTVWDPFPVLCPSEPCSSTHDGRPQFIDGDHISAYGNRRLYESFRAEIWRVLQMSEG